MGEKGLNSSDVLYCIKMYKLIFDSDALIKLIKTRLPKMVFKGFKTFITNEVYEECVIGGKKAFFEDAFVIESLVKEGLIKKIQTRKSPEIENLLRHERFGKGEESVLHLYGNINAGVKIERSKFAIKRRVLKNFGRIKAIYQRTYIF